MTEDNKPIYKVIAYSKAVSMEEDLNKLHPDYEPYRIMIKDYYFVVIYRRRFKF